MEEDLVYDIRAILIHYGGDPPEYGNWRSMRCPFHSDRTASGRVSVNDGAFRCLACDAKGNGITLIMWKENVDWRCALGIYQEITGTTINRIHESDEYGRGRVSDAPRNYEGGRSILPDWYGQ